MLTSRNHWHLQRLEASELAPVIVDLVGNLSSDGNEQGPEVAPSVEECLGFVSLFFDQDGDGQISQAEVGQNERVKYFSDVPESASNR